MPSGKQQERKPFTAVAELMSTGIAECRLKVAVIRWPSWPKSTDTLVSHIMTTLLPGIIDNCLHIEIHLISLYILQSAADRALADIKDTY